MVILVPKFPACLRVQLEGAAGQLEVFFPEKGEHNDIFEPGRSAIYDQTGTGKVAMVLPDYLQGHTLGGGRTSRGRYIDGSLLPLEATVALIPASATATNVVQLPRKAARSAPLGAH